MANAGRIAIFVCVIPSFMQAMQQLVFVGIMGSGCLVTMLGMLGFGLQIIVHGMVWQGGDSYLKMEMVHGLHFINPKSSYLNGKN